MSSMSETVLGALMVLSVTGVLVCTVADVLWNRRRNRFGWSERALALDAPASAEQSRVSPYLRHGATAPDPELAHLAVRVAELKRRRLENPWPHAGACLFLLGSSLAVIVRSVDGGFVGLLWFGIAGSALAVCAPLLRRLMLARADLALAANRELAERYEVPEEEPPPPPRER